MKDIIAEYGCILHIGRQGENLAKRILFPVQKVIEAYGNGTFQLVNRRFREKTPYPVEVTFEDGIVYWEVTNVDTAIAGDGECELQFYVNDVLAKPFRFRTSVETSISGEGTGDVPEPGQSWVDQAIEAGMSAAESAAQAQAAADSILNLEVDEETTPAGSGISVSKEVDPDDGTITLVFGFAEDIGQGGSGLPSGGSDGDLLWRVGTTGVSWVTPASSPEQDNTRPITAAAVFSSIGNINALLETI